MRFPRSRCARASSIVVAFAAVAALAVDASGAAAGTAGGSPSATAGDQAAGRAAERSWPPDNWRVFDDRILVAYYGTAGTGALGVLGESSPRVMTKRLQAAARPFAHGDTQPQLVYELIASVADAGPGNDGDYSHFIDDAAVRRYSRAAQRHHALLVLDFQPGRSRFLPQVRHFAWALRKPWVGVAIDPEWRMRAGQVPAQVIGHVGAAEVNQVSAYVARVTRNHDLPQKVFMFHQFRTDMVRNIERVKSRPGLAMVQHVDGFGTRKQKLATYHAVAKAAQFHQGFKLFYDEDTNIFRPRQVLRIRPRVQFVSYQ